jgi:hypothetical protein
MARAQLLMQSLQGEGQEESQNKKEKNKTSNDGNGANKKELETDGKHEGESLLFVGGKFRK